MELEEAVDALGALAQENRLAVFRLLVQTGKDGLPAGEIARALAISPSSLSFHLSHLARSGLVSQERQSRQIIYRAEYPAMDRLVAYLLENCCSGEACEAAPRLGEKAC